MTKYRALKDVPPHIKQGDIVDFKDPLVDGYKPLFEKVGAGEKTDETNDDGGNGGSTITGNLDRNALKDRATALNIPFAPNIPTDRLVELVTEAEEKAKSDAAGGGTE